MTRRILLIEDEQLSRDIITSLLHGQGYAVDVAIDGFAALEQARKTRYDAALIDYHLPEMDGYTLGRLLREQHPGGATGPVLIGLTADSNGLAARRGSDAVFRAILPKPIKPAELFSTIERLCAASGSNPDAAPQPTTVTAPVGSDDARRSAAAIWLGHGLAAPPRAFASPPPTLEQAAALTLCFDLVGPEQAQCVVLLERHGINEALRVKKRDACAPTPIIGLSADHADICDHLFRVDDLASWRALAVMLGGRTAAVVSLPTPPRPYPAAVVEAPPAPAGRPAESPAKPAPAATAVAASELRLLMQAGVQRPLDALRRDLAGATAPAADAARERHGRLEALDAILLAAGSIADALNPPTARATQPASFDPAELAENALAMIRDSRPPGAVSLKCRVSETLPQRLRGDVHRLGQVVLTLLDDACAGSEPVALVLHVRFDAAQGLLVLRLETGDGRAGPETGEGVIALLRNLRLTMLSRLVGLMGGALSQQSGEIVLTLPAELAAAPQSRGDGGRADDAAHVLLIDDGATSGQLLTLLLTQKGHRVCRVGDGEGALFACRDARHDLVVFDLPVGRQARSAALAGLAAFRSGQPDLPAIALASAISPEDQSALDELRIDRTLLKPFSPEALEDAVAACRRPAPETGRDRVAPIDAQVRAALVDALGEATVARLTGQLLEQIETLADAPELGVEARSRLVELAGCASVLGLAELASRCAQPERETMRAALQRLRECRDAPRRSAA